MARISARGINEEVLNQFKDFVRKKHGKMHTVFGKEIEDALASHLKNNGWELKNSFGSFEQSFEHEASEHSKQDQKQDQTQKTAYKKLKDLLTFK